MIGHPSDATAPASVASSEHHQASRRRAASSSGVCINVTDSGRPNKSGKVGYSRDNMRIVIRIRDPVERVAVTDYSLIIVSLGSIFICFITIYMVSVQLQLGQVRSMTEAEYWRV